MTEKNRERYTVADAVFVRDYLRHGNASRAYRVAFPKSNGWKPKTVNEKASALLNTGKVQTRVTEHRKKTEQRTGWTRDKWLKMIATEIRGKKPGDRIKALEMYGKAQGYFAPVKVENVNEGSSLILIGIPGAPEAKLIDAEEVAPKQLPETTVANVNSVRGSVG